jgi:hypothetical protein
MQKLNTNAEVERRTRTTNSMKQTTNSEQPTQSTNSEHERRHQSEITIKGFIIPKMNLK